MRAKRTWHVNRVYSGQRLNHDGAYRSWRAMIQRCTDPNAISWKNYGGRGIEVCARWLEFPHFLADMGDRPEGLTLDRINNDGNYEPSNCRWTTYEDQAYNRRIWQRENPVTHCKNGHAFTESNTHLDASGKRHCRTCDRERWRALHPGRTQRGAYK